MDACVSKDNISESVRFGSASVFFWGGGDDEEKKSSAFGVVGHYGR